MHRRLRTSSVVYRSGEDPRCAALCALGPPGAVRYRVSTMRVREGGEEVVEVGGSSVYDAVWDADAEYRSRCRRIGAGHGPTLGLETHQLRGSPHCVDGPVYVCAVDGPTTLVALADRPGVRFWVSARRVSPLARPTAGEVRS